jgi:DNA-binding CsgD family transcriptional regulator
VLPKRGDYGRAKRRLEAALEPVPDSADGVVETFLTSVADVLDLHSSCWHQSDPATGSPVYGAVLSEPPGSFMESMQYEFRRRDVNTFADLIRDRGGVASIFLATGERPGTSLRFREMIEPTGVCDELRVWLKDAFGVWATVVAFTRRRMTEADVSFITEVAPTVTRAVRRTTAAEWRTTVTAIDDPGPSVLMLDADDHVLAADATARRRLQLLPDHQPSLGGIPGVIAYLAARARWDAAADSATARMRLPDGRWFLLDASAMDDAAGNVAVVMQPAAPASVLTHVLRSYGLSAREREIASLLAQGHSAKSIASTLVISPWTVQDHIKAVYRKTGVTARSDLTLLTT